MTAPWFQADVDSWRASRVSLIEQGVVWPDGLIVNDLRWWEDQQRMGKAKMPSSRKLAEQWGVTHWKARQMMKSSWHAPGLRAHAPHSRRTPPAQPPHTSRTLDPVEPGIVDAAPHSRRTSPAQSPHELRNTRVPTEHRAQSTEPEKTPSGSPPKGPPGGSVPAARPLKGQLALTVPPKPSATGPTLPAWASKIRHKGASKRRVVEVLLEVVSAVTERPLEAQWAQAVGQKSRPGTRDHSVIKAGEAQTSVKGCLSLLRAKGSPDIEAWRDDALLMADAFHRCPHPTFARSVRAEGWEGGTDRSRHMQTFARQTPWDDRLAEARRWDAQGRPTAKSSTRAAGAASSLDFDIPDVINLDTPAKRRTA